MLEEEETKKFYEKKINFLSLQTFIEFAEINN